MSTYDALPNDYKTHIGRIHDFDVRDMDKIEFLKAMLSYKTLNKAQRAVRGKETEKNKEALKKYNSRNRGSRSKELDTINKLPEHPGFGDEK